MDQENQNTEELKSEEKQEIPVVDSKRKEQIKFAKSVAKTFVTAFFVVVSLFCFVMLTLPVLAPRAAVSLYSSLGMNKAIFATKQIQYDRSGEVEDLYNVMIEAKSQKNWELASKYAQELLEHKSFDAFASGYETWAKNNSKMQDWYAVASLKNTTYSILVESQWYIDKTKSLETSTACFEANDIELFYFASYVNCVMTDETLTENKKIETIKSVATSQKDGKTVLDLVAQRYDVFAPEELQNADILLLERLWETKNIELTLLESLCTLENHEFDDRYELVRSQVLQLANIIECKIS